MTTQILVLFIYLVHCKGVMKMFVLGAVTGWLFMGFFIAIPVFMLFFLASLVLEENSYNKKKNR